MFWIKIKNDLRKNPQVFSFFKKLAKLPILSNLNKKLSPATERFDKERGDSEIDYVNAYSTTIVNFINSYSKDNATLLDIGCGYGYVTEILVSKTNISHVYALDKISPEEFRIDNKDIKFISTDITSLYLEKENLPNFDIISSSEFIEHISEEDAKKLIRWIFKHLKKGGLFVGSTPNNLTHLLKYSDSPFHIREYSTFDFTKILKEVGFSDIEIIEDQDFFVWKAIAYEN